MYHIRQIFEKIVSHTVRKIFISQLSETFSRIYHRLCWNSFEWVGKLSNKLKYFLKYFWQDWNTLAEILLETLKYPWVSWNTYEGGEILFEILLKELKYLWKCWNYFWKRWNIFGNVEILLIRLKYFGWNTFGNIEIPLSELKYFWRGWNTLHFWRGWNTFGEIGIHLERLKYFRMQSQSLCSSRHSIFIFFRKIIKTQLITDSVGLGKISEMGINVK